MAIEPYKTSSGEDIEIKEIVKDLGVLATNDLMFREHIGKVTTECRVIMADLMRTLLLTGRRNLALSRLAQAPRGRGANWGVDSWTGADFETIGPKKRK